MPPRVRAGVCQPCKARKFSNQHISNGKNPSQLGVLFPPELLNWKVRERPAGDGGLSCLGAGISALRSRLTPFVWTNLLGNIPGGVAPLQRVKRLRISETQTTLPPQLR